MSYSKLNYEEVEPMAPGMYFLREALECEQFGFTVIEGDDEWVGKEHDHAEGEHEELYLLIEGEGRLTVEDESVPLLPGDAIRVPPNATRQLEFTEESRLVVVGAP